MGGREVLHAAISADDGLTWRGFREVLHEPPVASRGDRGTAYASAAETSAGKIVIVSGQGEGKRAIVAFDPHWLEEREVRDDLGAGPVAWTHYGAEGLRVEALEDGARAVAIPLRSPGPCGALWNFPMADAGELRLRLQVPREAGDLRLCLNDHFNRADDKEAAVHAVFGADLAKWADDRSHEVVLRWRDAARGGELKIEIDGQPGRNISAQRPAQFGVNYLRIEFRATTDTGRVLVSHLSARVQ